MLFTIHFAPAIFAWIIILTKTYDLHTNVLEERRHFLSVLQQQELCSLLVVPRTG